MAKYTLSKVVSDEDLSCIIQIESSGKPKAKAPKSSALGLFQFISGTWMGVVRKHMPDLLRNRTESQVLDLRTDPHICIQLGARFTEDNARALGPGWHSGDLYLAHFLGVGTALRFMRADPSANAERLAGVAAAKANPTILVGKTVGAVRAWADRVMLKAQGRNWIDKFMSNAPRPPVQSPASRIPDEVAADKVNASPMSGRVNPVTEELQRHLNAMGYHVGEVDGKWGGMTKGAVAAYKLDRGLSGIALIDDALLADVDRALVQDNTDGSVGFKRPIARERKEAKPEELAPKLPEVDASIKSERVGFWGSIATMVVTVVGGIKEFLGEALSWLDPLKEFATDVPSWVWIIGGVVVAGALYYVSLKSGAAKQASTEAYREGARV